MLYFPSFMSQRGTYASSSSTAATPVAAAPSAEEVNMICYQHPEQSGRNSYHVLHKLVHPPSGSQGSSTPSALSPALQRPHRERQSHAARPSAFAGLDGLVLPESSAFRHPASPASPCGVAGFTSASSSHHLLHPSLSPPLLPAPHFYFKEHASAIGNADSAPAVRLRLHSSSSSASGSPQERRRRHRRSASAKPTWERRQGSSKRRSRPTFVLGDGETSGELRRRSSGPPAPLRSTVCPDATDEDGVPDPDHDCDLLGCERVLLNVSGMHFETRRGILERHPRTLLGNWNKRKVYYDATRQEYFFDRHRPTFEAIFNYYQYGGKIKRPNHVPDDIFLSELEFYEIEKEVIDTYKRDEGYVIENVVLPENPFKRRVWMLFEYPETSTTAFFIAVSSVIFTVISIILFCVETLPMFATSHCVAGEAPNFLDPFFIVESMCTFWFTLEVIVRFLVCPSVKSYVKDLKNAVDVAAVVPYYVTLINVLISFSCDGAKGSASLAFLRVIRLIRVFKLTKHSPGLQVLVLTFRASLEGLSLFLVALIVCILVFSSTIYYVEADNKNSHIESIPDAFWWAIITMCTVGYGDMVPQGPLGKLVGSCCALAGVLTLAIPVPIITENFNKFYTHKTGRGKH